MLNMIYNNHGLQDTLIVNLHPVPEKYQTETIGNIVRIFDGEETYGYNILAASTLFEVPFNGVLMSNERFVETVIATLHEVGFAIEPSELEPHFVVGFVDSMVAHPKSDHLNVCQVQTDTGTVQIVCGAPNVASGQKVVVAKIGALMPSGLYIQASKVRDVESFGMICSARELALPDAPQEKGILVLEDDAPIGAEFFSYYK
ncbi:YtpR family tRNA-binding protein [Culicoidibacter larvae]|uniref:YtpR family tRNA-binding protein n=1 Tax=Culicoidibacter larvae TaxID=2579976 RepID=UPI001485AB0B|nr:DUF4479 domain-containing protein [Culicoidibacter larvae]